MGRKQAECLLKLYWASNIRGKETQRYRETLAQWPHTHTHTHTHTHAKWSTYNLQRVFYLTSRKNWRNFCEDGWSDSPRTLPGQCHHKSKAREPTGTDGITCTFQPTVLSKSDWLKVWLTFFIPRQVEGAWNVDHRPGRSIWPAGVSVKRPVTEQAH